MKCFSTCFTRLALVVATAYWLVGSSPCLAVTDTWDGGGADNNLSTNLNWVDNTAPVSDLVNTDIVFAGNVRLTPIVSVPFSTDSITFNNTAGAFSIGGGQLNLGAGGITNNDANTDTFTNLINFGLVANSTINAASGGLTFSAVFLPTGTLTVDGANATSFLNFVDSTALTKQGAGTMTWSPTATQTLDLTISAGTVTMGADASTDVFSSAASIAVNGTSTLNINERMTLDGAQLTRASGAALTLAAGKTLTVQNGGDAIITGSFSNTTASTIAVTGAGSTFTTTSGLNINAASALNVTSGGAVSNSAGTINIGTSNNGTATVDGSGSSFVGGLLIVGLNGNTGSLTFRNSSTGAFGHLSVANDDPNTSGTLNIESGASVTGTGLHLAPNFASETGTITITGAGSALTLTGDTNKIIGSGDSSTATMNVQSGGTFNSGPNPTELRATGTINIDGGTVNFAGPLTLAGGTINFNSGALSIVENFTAGAGGLLGSDVIFDATRTFTTTATTTIDASHTLTLDGGTLNTGNLVVNGTFNFIAGALGITQAGSSINTPIVTGNPSTININANNISLGSAASFNGFNHQGTLNVGANTVLLNSAGYARLGTLTSLAGGTINAPNGVTFPSGSNFLGHGSISAQVTGELGSVIEADGALALGDATSPAGFTFGGQLRAKQFAVTLNSGSQAGMGNLTTIGSGASPGTLNVTNGLVIDFAESITGFGTINSTNTLAKRTIINGLAQGNSVAQPLTFTGFVKGVGTFDNVAFTGTFDPGLSPTLSTVGSISLGDTNTLIMELGGISRGSQYDAILASGTLGLDGTLQVTLIGGFMPTVGQSFDILDWASLSGTFSAIQLPTLAGTLAWNTSQLYTTGVLSVVSAGVPGDYNNNGVVDAADYVLWRNGGPLANEVDTPGTVNAADYAAWRARFGNTAGSGSSSAFPPPPSPLLNAVPEPASLLLLFVASLSTLATRRSRYFNVATYSSC